MKRFCKLFTFTLLAAFFGSFSVAQGIPSGFVQTTWTVPGIANWSFSTSWTNLSSSPQLGLLNGVSTFPITTTGQVSLGGYGVTLLADTAQIVPTPSTWTFQFTCPAGYIGGFSLQVAVTGGGGTQDISTQVAAAEPPNNVCTPSGGGGGSGGLTTFTTGNLPPLFTSTLGPDPTHNPALRFTQDTAANSTFFGNFSGVTANPDFWNLVAGTNISFGINTGTKTLTINSVSNLMIQHANSSTGILQTLMNWQDTPANLSGGSLDSGYQPVVFKTDTAGGWAAETLATFSLAPYSTPPIAGQHAIAYPTGFSTTCATGSNTTGKTVVTNGGCNAMVTWTFSAPGGNITTTSGATIPIANVTAVYPFVTSAATIQSGNATPSNFFETTCTGTGVTLDVTQQGVQSGTLNFPLHQYTSSTSLTVSLANYNAMTCDISASEIDGSVGTPNIVNGQATLTAAYIYYTGPPVSSPNQYYVQGPLNFDTTTDTLSLPLPYDVAFDFGTSGTTYAIQNSNFTSAVAGLKTTFCAANANTTTAPTLNMNGWGAWTIFGPTGGALSLNDITPCAGASGTGQMINVQLTQTAAGMQWWLQNPKTEGGSGGVTGSGTANTLTKWTGTSVVGNSSVTDDGTTPTRAPNGIDTATGGNFQEWTAFTGGVTAGQAMCVTSTNDGSGRPEVTACSTGGSGAGFVGIAKSTVTAGNSVDVCWSVNCAALFDGAVTQNHTAVVSTTVAGELHDTGTTTAPAGQSVVVNIYSSNSGAGTTALVGITGSTPTGGGSSLPPATRGQFLRNAGTLPGNNWAGGYPSPWIANGGNPITTSYTLLCDSSSSTVGIQDRNTVAIIGAGGSVTIPDVTGTGCAQMFGWIENSDSAAHTISRQTSGTFTIYGTASGSPLTGQTTYSLPAGATASYRQDGTNDYALTIQLFGAGGTTVNVNGSPVSNPNFNGTTPAAPANNVNGTFQTSGSSVSVYVPNTTTVNGVGCVLGSSCTISAGTTIGVQHEFVFSATGTQAFTHNLGIQYPFFSCATKSGAQFDPTWMTWTDANNVSMNAPAATDTVCNFGQSNTATSLSNPAACPDTSGSGTAQSCTTTPTITVANNACIAYSTTTSNSGTGLTIAVNGGGAASVAINVSGSWTTSLQTSPASIAANHSYLMCYDGTAWDVQTQTTVPASTPLNPFSAGSSNVLTGIVPANWSAIGGSTGGGGSPTNTTIAGLEGTGSAIEITSPTGGGTNGPWYGVQTAVSGSWTHTFAVGEVIPQSGQSGSAIGAFVGVAATDGTNWEGIVVGQSYTSGNATGLIIIGSLKNTAFSNSGTIAGANGALSYNLNAPAFPFTLVQLSWNSGTHTLTGSYSPDGGVTFIQIFSDSTPALTPTAVCVITSVRGGTNAMQGFLESYQ